MAILETDKWSFDIRILLGLSRFWDFSSLTHKASQQRLLHEQVKFYEERLTFLGSSYQSGEVYHQPVIFAIGNACIAKYNSAAMESKGKSPDWTYILIFKQLQLNFLLIYDSWVCSAFKQMSPCP